MLLSLAILVTAHLEGAEPPGTPVGGERDPEVLSLEEALRIGLERNHGVRTARIGRDIATVHRSAAGWSLLPSVGVSGSTSAFTERSWVREAGIETRDRTGLDEFGVGAQFGWTVFDGFGMFANRRRASAVERLGTASLQLEIDETARDIILTYYAIAREQRVLSAMEDAISFSEARLEIARTMRELGSMSEFDVLLARTDLNTDRAIALRQVAVVEQFRLELVRILGLPTDTVFEVEAEIPLGEPPAPDEVMAALESESRELEAARQRERIALHARSQARATRLPTVTLQADYGRAWDQDRLGSDFREEARGFRLGVAMRLPVFDGLSRRRDAQVADLEVAASRTELEGERVALEVAVRVELMNAANARELVGLEEENLALADEAMRIALEQFRAGSITSNELRETQRVVIDTETRLVEARYDAKRAETELRRLSGTLDREGDG